MMRQVSSAILAVVIVLTFDITRDVLRVADGVWSVISEAFGAINVTFDISDDAPGIGDDGWRAIDEENCAADETQGVSDDTQDIIDDVICIIFCPRAVASLWESGLVSNVRVLGDSTVQNSLSGEMATRGLKKAHRDGAVGVCSTMAFPAATVALQPHASCLPPAAERSSPRAVPSQVQLVDGEHRLQEGSLLAIHAFKAGLRQVFPEDLACGATLRIAPA